MVLALGHPSALLVRSVHVLAMAVLVGGAVLVWGVLHYGPPAIDTRPALRSAAVYEWAFWGGVSLAVLTGVGNLGALAPAVPRPGTVRGAVLAVKVAAVIVLLVGSLPRTLVVLRRLDRAESSPHPPDRLRVAYGLTGLYLIGLVGLAEVLAHG